MPLTPGSRLADPSGHLRALYRLTQATTQAADLDAVYREALDTLAGDLGADRAAVLRLDAAGAMRFAASRGLSPTYQAAVEGHSPWAPDDPAPAPVVIGDVATEPSLGALRPTVLAEGIGAIAFIPLVFEGRLLGKFMLYFDEPHHFVEEELDVARTVAGHIAFVLEKRRLEDELRAGSDQLADILTAIGEAITVQQADGSLVWANEAAAELIGFPSPAELLASPVHEVLAQFELFDASGAPFPLSELPGRRALAGEEPPEVLLRWRVRATGDEHWSLVRSRPVRNDDGRVRFAVSVFRDVTSRQQALDALRRSEERFAFLASASRALLGSSLDADAVAARVVDLVVPVLADWCSAWGVDGHGRPQRHAARLAASYRPELAGELAGHAQLLTGHPLWDAVLGGDPVLLTDPEDALAGGLAGDDHHRRLVAELGMRSVLAVPVMVRGAATGVLLMGSTEAGRYGDADVALAEDLARRAAQALEIARAYEAEHGARELAEAATARLALVSEVSRALTTTLRVEELLERLSRVIVPAFADHCVIDLAEAGGTIRRVVVAGATRELGEQLARFAPDPGNDAHPVVRALGGETTLIGEVTDDLVHRATSSREHRAAVRALGARSAITVPIWGRKEAVGAITFGSVANERRLGIEDVGLAEEIGRRAGSAIENARLFAERSAAATTLSQALLPARLPEIPGVELAVRYRPAAAGVGGDFYDVVPLVSGGWLLLVGDVCGKGAEAAALTAMARHTVRTLAREYGDPVQLLHAANAVMTDQLPDGRFCTVAVAVVEPRGERWAVSVVVAGHPPPLVVRRTGQVATVGRGGRLLGVFGDLDLCTDGTALERGDALVMVTDGCVGEGVEAQDVLAPALATVAGGAAADLADRVLATADALPSDHPDDRAVLVLRVS